MIFLDCGNSQIKAQYFQANHLQASFACSYRADWNHHLSRWLEPLECTHAHLCSVLDRERQVELDACLARQFGGSTKMAPSPTPGTGKVRQPKVAVFLLQPALWSGPCQFRDGRCLA